jgi:hypothetical protein
VESSRQFGAEPSGSKKCWETIEWLRKLLASRAVLRSIELVSCLSHLTSRKLCVPVRSVGMFVVVSFIFLTPYYPQKPQEALNLLVTVERY